MKTASDILRELRIEERPGRGGSFMTTCPACSHTRKKKKDRCLSVRIDSLGVRYFCQHCRDFKGGVYFDGGEDKREWTKRNYSQPQAPRRTLASYYR